MRLPIKKSKAPRNYLGGVEGGKLNSAFFEKPTVFTMVFNVLGSLFCVFLNVFLILLLQTTVFTMVLHVFRYGGPGGESGNPRFFVDPEPTKI